MPIYNPRRAPPPSPEVLAASKLRQKKRVKRQAAHAEELAREATPKEECEHCNEEFLASELSSVNSRGQEEQWCSQCVEDDAFTCEGGCDEVYDNDEAGSVMVDGNTRLSRHETWCESCREGAGFCERCEETVPGDDVQSVRVEGRRGQDHQIWCDLCARTDGFRCNQCDERCSDDISAGDVDGNQWCRPCYENYGNYCEDHDYQYSDYCPDCENEDDESELVRDYHAAKKRGFHPLNSSWVEAQPKPIYFGLELEVEVPSGKDIDTYAQQIVDSMPDRLLAGMEHDGSLAHGFEIVTHPAGLDMHRECWSRTNLKGLKSHDTTTCGLHIHVTRSAISKLTLGKMLSFTYAEYNKTFMEVFARRSFVSYAKHIPDMKISTGTKSRPERYEAWNTTNANTVEFRLPKGTTKITTIIATLEFVYALIRFCEEVSAQELNVEGFKAFIADDAYLTETRFLRAYLVDRGLANAKEMRLPKIKPGTPPREDAAPTENPRRNPEPSSYGDLALADYEANGEDSTSLA